MALRGADVEQLRALSKAMANAAEQLSRISGQTTSQLGSTTWRGPAAERFRNQWNSESVRALNTVAGSLKSTSGTLRLNADEQDQASAATVGAGDPAPVSSGSSGQEGFDPNDPGDWGLAFMPAMYAGRVVGDVAQLAGAPAAGLIGVYDGIIKGDNPDWGTFGDAMAAETQQVRGDLAGIKNNVDDFVEGTVSNVEKTVDEVGKNVGNVAKGAEDVAKKTAEGVGKAVGGAVNALGRLFGG